MRIDVLALAEQPHVVEHGLRACEVDRHVAAREALVARVAHVVAGDLELRSQHTSDLPAGAEQADPHRRSASPGLT